MIKQLGTTILKVAECIFLHAYGWTRIRGEWTPPKTYERPKKVGNLYKTGHAVNSQKYTSRMLNRYKRDQKFDRENPEFP